MPNKNALLKSATDIYTVDSRIGGGGVGDVYLVRDVDGVNLAAKVLRPTAHTKQLKRFKNELMFGLRESHPNLVKVLDFGRSDEDESFYVMPFADGTLRTLLRQGIPVEKRLTYFADILDGVEAAHLKGTIHRDLKPENILFFQSASQLRVGDFGAAHFEEDHLFTQVDTLPTDRLANFEYAAPEQRRPGATVDLRADIYALGLILAELFTGVVPHGVGATKIGTDSPDFAYLDELVEKLRQHDPSSRPTSVNAIKLELMARKNDFIEKQKLDRLRNTVVKDSLVTDILVTEPPAIIGVAFTGSGLTFNLSQRPTSKWIQTFQNMPVGGLLGYGPEYHTFQLNMVTIRCPERLAQQIVDQFKHYLAEANRRYALAIQQEERERVSVEKSKLASEIAQAEAIARVQSKLRW